MFELSSESVEEVKKQMARFETIESAIIPSLYAVQKQNQGWINDEAIEALSKVMQIPSSRINEVFKFYTMFNQKKVGKYHVQLCGTLSCHINGAPDISDFLCQNLDIGLDEVTADGKFSISRVECLGSCGTGPMMQVNETYYESLTPELALSILKGLP